MRNIILKQQATAEMVCDIVSNISLFDAVGEAHIHDTLAWIKSDEPIFRIAKLNVPNKPLVS